MAAAAIGLGAAAPERFEAVARCWSVGVTWQRRSDWTREGSRPARVLLVDVVGELGAWWGTPRIAFVGGSLGNRGGQNMIEPAAYGAAVSFGPNTRNFRDIVAAMWPQAAVVVADAEELTRCRAAASIGEPGTCRMRLGQEFEPKASQVPWRQLTFCARPARTLEN